MRKPSLKRSLKARTTGKWKRKVKKSFIPGYGKKGVGWLKNPKKAAYNKVYNKTTFSISDLFKFSFKSKSKRPTKKTVSEKREDEIMENNGKVPFYKRKWFIILVSVFVPVAGVAFVLTSKKMNKVAKIVLTAIASLWSLILLVIGFAGGDTDTTAPVETTTQAIVEESTTHGGALDETTEQVTEESTTAQTTEQTTEETTTKPATTKKETTTRQTTTKKETTTAKPTTAKKPATTKNTNSNSSSSNADFVGNANTGKFHYTWCDSVDKMSDDNKVYLKGTRDDCVRKGYDPCGKCNP